MQLHRERAAIRKRSAELVFVGNGNRHFAEAFQKEFAIGAPLYVDTKRDAYKALEMKRTFAGTLASLNTWRGGLRALRTGFRPGSVRGDAWQLGGVVVVQPGGRIAYRYLSDTAGDHPPVVDVLAALSAPSAA